MGESKRRKKALGSNYGCPLGLSKAQRKMLLHNNFRQLFSQYQKSLGYDCCFEQPSGYDAPSFTRTTGVIERVEESLNDAVRHWQQTFQPQLDFSFLFAAIVNDLPVCLTNLDGEVSPPVVAVPLARQKFRTLVLRQKINWKQHQLLIQDVLEYLALTSSQEMITTILRHEFREAIDSLIETKQDWIRPHLVAPDCIELDDEVIKNVMNYAITGFLTLIATLHWEEELQHLKKDV